VAFRPNLGECPPHARGKRVRGVLRNGMRFGFEPVANAVPAGWPADGKEGCNWDFTPEGRPSREFDIVEWEIVR
jgi:hypothetical protein